MWRYLAALVLLPLVGVVVLAAAAAQARAAEAESAERAEAAVRALALLDAARSGAEREMMPILSLHVIDDPAAAAALGIPTSLLQAQRSTAMEQAERARELTDEALAQVPAGSIGARAADRAAADLAVLRNLSHSGELDVEEVYIGFLAVSTDLMAAQETAAAAATAEGVPGATLRAIRDVQTVAHLAQSASRQMPLYLGSLFTGGGDTIIGSRTAWQTAWLDYTDAQRQMDSLSQDPLVEQWRETRGSPAVTRVDGVLATGLGAGVARDMEIGDVVTLIFASQERSVLLTELVAAAVSEVQELVSADRERAHDRLQLVFVLGASLLAGSLLGAILLGHSVARALRLLAGQATQISEGSLVEVEVAGPREVRTVSAALGSAVAGLRRIQDQAQGYLLYRPMPAADAGALLRRSQPAGQA
ncbi:HAMP domain-containing protein [Blastococcus saxobsidens]|uniref:Putative Diguanylate cyclase/phosphodiesterase n=1 Tax=Blastococcus saxobsidens (strain DD2) TaxID=1146883 RepID=H6RRC0_BLASD|nr:HAMP domain-containing protein [Blastococcus saxobsidens]CCG05402.1 Putative Diguanylate cyclase/phosphodiesterase [Blastococcus saxobsidens DD2]